jgi:hypothetical protein
MQVDVEGHEVEELGQIEILGGREVGVADERPRGLLLDVADQPAQEFAHPLRPVPANDIGRDLVADEQPEEGRVAAEVLCRRPHGATDLRHDVLAVEKADVLRPRNGDQHAQSVLGRPVEQPARRDREGAERVGPQLRHQPEVGLDHVLGREGEAVRRHSERAVGHAPDVELVVADEEELAAHGNGRAIERRSGSPLGERAQHGLAHTGGCTAGR